MEGKILTWLVNGWPWTFLGIVLLIIGIVAVIWRFVLRPGRIKKGPKPEASTTAAVPPPGSEPAAPGKTVIVDFTRSPRLVSAFRRGMYVLQQHVSGRDYRYRIPWYALLGPVGSRSPDLLANAGLTLPYGHPRDLGFTDQLGCSWWFFDRGVVLDLAGEYVLGVDGKSSYESGWRSFLRLLQQHRPQRPLDGIVLTLACADVLGAADGGEPLASLEQKGDALYRKLVEAQITLGLRVPIYVLVTGTDQIPGFTSFVEAMETRHYDELVGWSNPYAVDSAYQSEWIAEAFDNMGMWFERARLRFLASERLGLEREDCSRMFLFPREFQGLREPLKSFLARLFKPSAYHESFFFRGLYFCATEAGGRPARESRSGVRELSLTTEEAGRRTLFVNELFDTKVFPEYALAAPTSGTLNLKNRRVRYAQAGLLPAALVLGIGLIHGYTGLKRQAMGDAARDEPGLQHVLRELSQMVSARGSGRGLSKLRGAEAAKRYVELMAETDMHWFGSAFIPPSWLSGVNRDLTHSMGIALNKVVLPAMQDELGARFQSRTALRGKIEEALRPLTETEETTLGVGNLQVKPLADVSSFNNLRNFVVELRELENLATQYDMLFESNSLGDFSRVSSELLGQPLPEEFRDRSYYFRRALGESQRAQFELGKYQRPAEGRAGELAESFYESFFRRNVLARDHKELLELIDRIRQGGEPSLDADNVTASLVALLALISRTEAVHLQPELRWAFREDFDLGPEFDGLLMEVSDSVLLGPQVASEIHNQSYAEWRQLQANLARFTSGFTPEQRQAIQSFLDYDFVRNGATHPSEAVAPADSWIYWESRPLEQSLTLNQSYQRFLEETLPPIPNDLKPAVLNVARRRLGANMMQAVSRAYRTEPRQNAGSPIVQEPRLRQAIANFQAAAPTLNQILGVLDQLELESDYLNLSNLLANQGEDLLNDIDDLLKTEALYLPKGQSFTWWTGSPNVVFEAYGVADQAGLQSYLGSQRARIQQLASQYAQPLVSALSTNFSEPRSAAFEKWESIITELANYDTQKPGNALSSLESYVSEKMPQINLDNCFETPPGSTRGVGGLSFFGERQRRLENALYVRCQELAVAGAVAGYRELERFFKQRLAGRFPFTTGLVGRRQPQASLDDIRSFYRLFDKYERFILTIPSNHASFGGAGEEVHEFILVLKEARPFFATLLAEEEAAPELRFTFGVEFRVNRAREIDADQIIGWDFEVDQQRIGFWSEVRTGQWTLGDPVRFTLRWAKDGPRAPQAGPVGPSGSFESRAVIFEDSSPWALLRFVQANRASEAELAELEDVPHVLKFEIPTVPVTPAGEPGPVSQWKNAIAFIRVTLTPPGEKQEPIALPEIFPQRAPELPLVNTNQSSSVSGVHNVH